MIRTLSMSRSISTTQSGPSNRGRGGYAGQYNFQGNRNPPYKRKNESQAGPSGWKPNKAQKPNPDPSPDSKQEEKPSAQKFRRGSRGRGGRK